ncbi:hypothetical protein MLD38_005286 [Melastoma candidum]|uniref:Uncharacterized protein n=1 Tax=Melastoma candidum TaxID=119954 RepID=A0ACB9S9Y1_9MYRT|nr:hypothetical protein MLD38_005286 [Melastoma candidum]
MSQRHDHLLFTHVKVKDMVTTRRLVEVPYTASLAHTINALVANSVVAVPVAAPPGQWIGAGGSMIMETDRATGSIRKHYIGMVTMLDILSHIAGDDRVDGTGGDRVSDLDQRMEVPVSSIIGQSLEGLSLWTLNPNTSILDCMEVFSKGIHRALIPAVSQMENVTGVELVESASSYRMVTQMDLLRFVMAHASELKDIMSRTVKELGAVNRNVFAITDRTRVIEAIKCMRAAMLNAVPIVAASDSGEDHGQLLDGYGKSLVGTFSATDIRRCHVSEIEKWLSATAQEFTESISAVTLHNGGTAATSSSRELVTCGDYSPLSEAIEKAVTKHVHRVWVVDGELLVGLVSLTDIIRVLRLSLLSA